MSLELKNVMIQSLATDAQEHEIPVESLSLDFEEITMKYYEYDLAGKVKSTQETSWKIELAVE